MHNSPWFSAIERPKAAERRLFCLPHAGGGTAAFHRWKPLLPDTIELVTIKLPGREDRFEEAPYEDLDTLARKIAQEIEPLVVEPEQEGGCRYAIFGHSMGAAIAYRTIVHLARNNSPRPTVLFVSACRSPTAFRDDPPLHTLEDQAMLEGLINRYGATNGTDAQSSGELEMMRLMAKTIRADLKMLETYKHDDAPPIECDIFALGGTDDPQVTRGDLQRWQDLTAAKFSTRMFPGHHFYLRNQEKAVVKTVVSRFGSIAR